MKSIRLCAPVGKWSTHLDVQWKLLQQNKASRSWTQPKNNNSYVYIVVFHQFLWIVKEAYLKWIKIMNVKNVYNFDLPTWNFVNNVNIFSATCLFYGEYYIIWNCTIYYSYSILLVTIDVWCKVYVKSQESKQLSEGM